MTTKQRLDKYLSHVGYATRAKMRIFLKENVVTVNGEEVFDPSIKIDPEKDKVTINDDLLPLHQEFEYYILNKPKNVISTTNDELGRETVVDLVEASKQVFPVGRLDKDTTGLVLLTNDGPLTHKLIHPMYHVPKTYMLTIAGEVIEKEIKFFEKGVMLKEGKTLPAQAKIIQKTDEHTIVEAILHEGRFQQIRRMCYALHWDLIDLQRIAFGPITIGTLQEGESRKLTKEEVETLKTSAKKPTHQNQSA
jgi:23S rRNA pseudouridine2605 synthase